MTVTRLMIVLLIGLIPLAGLREVWWSEILFLKPWESAGGDKIGLGAQVDLLRGWLAGIWTILIGVFLAIGMDVASGYLRRFTLPVIGLAALLSAIGSILIFSGLAWQASWIVFGFVLVGLLWIYASLQVGRRF